MFHDGLDLEDRNEVRAWKTVLEVSLFKEDELDLVNHNKHALEGMTLTSEANWEGLDAGEHEQSLSLEEFT